MKTSETVFSMDCVNLLRTRFSKSNMYIITQDVPPCQSVDVTLAFDSLVPVVLDGDACEDGDDLTNEPEADCKGDE